MRPVRSAARIAAVTSRSRKVRRLEAIAIIDLYDLQRVEALLDGDADPRVDLPARDNSVDRIAQKIDLGALPRRRTDPLPQIGAYRGDVLRRHALIEEVRLDCRGQCAAGFVHPKF